MSGRPRAPFGLLLLALAAGGCGADRDPLGVAPPVPPSSAEAIAAAPEPASPEGPPNAPTDPFEAADRLFEERRNEESAAAYEELLAAARGRRDRAAAWRAQLGWSVAMDRLRRDREAEAGLRAAQELAAPDPRRMAKSAYHLASFLNRTGRLDEALAEGESALALAERSGDPESESLAYGALGTTHSLAGRYGESLGFNERRVALWRRVDPTSPELARALNNVGIDYRHLGRYGEALAVFDEALALYRQGGDGNGQAIVLHNLANLRSSMGDTERALRLKLEALRLARRAGNLYGVGLLHNDLGEIYREAGNLAAARRHLERSLEINREAGQVYPETMALQFLGNLELDAGRPDTAEARFRAALALAERVGLGKEQATSRIGLARAAAAGGRGEAALRWAEEGLTRARELGDPEVEHWALEALGLAREAAGDAPGAAASFLEAIDLLESWRGRLALGDLALGLGEHRLGVYEGAIRTLLAEGDAAGAFQVAERARARRLLEVLAGRGGGAVPPPSGAPRELDELRRRLRERHGALERTEGPARRPIEAEIEALAARLEAVAGRERARHPAAGAARHPIAAPIGPVEARLASPGRALLAYYWGERDVYGWRVAYGRLTGARLGATADLAPRVEFLRAALEDPRLGDAWRGAAEAVGGAVLAPLAPGSIDELLVVPDGPLAYLPFEVLAARSGAPPLGLTSRFVYGPSASILLALASAPPAEGFSRTLLAVANPVVARAAAEAGTGALGRGELPPLPFAGREAREIGSLFRRRGADLLLGEAATLERWLALRPERYRFLHFAVHAHGSERGPEASHLVLGGGRLDLPTIRSLRLKAELVTLSGCETALGPRVRGEGVVGLPHAFLAAGARGVVVSLWRVEDRAAADFMRSVYAALAAGRAPAQALLEARRAAYHAGSGRSHPALWAPFVLVGGFGR